MQLTKVFPGPDRDQHPLGKFRVHLQTAYEIKDKFVIIPDGNNKANQWMPYVGIYRSEFR